jgi:DNA-3-methyladenine glycosylase I
MREKTRRENPLAWRDAGVILHGDGKSRCPWCGNDPLYVDYHDNEWGRPERCSRALFEKLALDGFQAGLSWLTILRKRGAVASARAWLALEEERGFSAYLWDFVDGRTIVNHPRRTSDIPAQTALSERIARDLKARGFKFCGPTIVYAFMQAVGMVDDHLVDCSRHESAR